MKTKTITFIENMEGRINLFLIDYIVKEEDLFIKQEHKAL